MLYHVCLYGFGGESNCEIGECDGGNRCGSDMVVRERSFLGPHD